MGGHEARPYEGNLRYARPIMPRLLELFTITILCSCSPAPKAAAPPQQSITSAPPLPEAEFREPPMVPGATAAPVDNSSPGAALAPVDTSSPAVPPQDNGSAPLRMLTPAERGVPAPSCTPADWNPIALGDLLRAGRRRNPNYSTSIVMGEGRPMTDLLGAGSPCDDSPQYRPRYRGFFMRTLTSGVTIRLLDAVPAGKSGRGWEGNQCSYELGSADGSGKPLVLGAEVIPPFTSIYSVVRRGSAAFVGLQFNGYAKEFPKGGCRVLAVDLCEGRVIWKSDDYTSNGDIVLIGNDYLITGYGFTAEKRILQVHDAHSGKVLQTLRIPGNPEALDFNQGVLTVKTNHGEATFELLR